MELAGGRLDWRAAGRGAVVSLVVALPPIVLVRILKGDDLSGEESNLWVVSVLALFAGFAMGGHAAARLRPRAPFVHAALAAGLAFGGLAVYTVARRLVMGDGVGLPLVVRLLLVGQITVSLAILGAYVATRREGRHRSSGSSSGPPVGPPASGAAPSSPAVAPPPAAGPSAPAAPPPPAAAPSAPPGASGTPPPPEPPADQGQSE